MSGIESSLPLVQELESSTTVKSRRQKHKTVAIVGFAPTSRQATPWDDTNVEIWGLNEAYHHDFMKRWDRWFQIHERWSFTRKNNANDPGHWEWLQEEHDFPIYMLKKYHDVPASVEYPWDDLIATLLEDKVVRGDPHEDGETNIYFTSSFAWMAALLAYEKVKGINDWGRLEVYGFEMATDTEYKHQKGSTEFWMGYLAALGIEVRVTKHCLLLKGEVYGKHVHSLLPKPVFETRLGQLKNSLNKSLNQMNETSTVIEGLEKEIIAIQEALKDKNIRKEARESLQKQLQLLGNEYEQTKNNILLAQSLANAYSGAEQETNALISYINSQDPDLGAEYSDEMQGSFVHRQELDFRVVQMKRNQENVMGQLNSLSGARQGIENRGRALMAALGKKGLKSKEEYAIKRELSYLTNERNKLLNNESQSLGFANAGHGALQIINEYLSMIDTILPLPDPDDELGRVLAIIGRIQIATDQEGGEDGKGTEETKE